MRKYNTLISIFLVLKLLSYTRATGDAFSKVLEESKTEIFCFRRFTMIEEFSDAEKLYLICIEEILGLENTNLSESLNLTFNIKNIFISEFKFEDKTFTYEDLEKIGKGKLNYISNFRNFFTRTKITREFKKVKLSFLGKLSSFSLETDTKSPNDSIKAEGDKIEVSSDKETIELNSLANIDNISKINHEPIYIKLEYNILNFITIRSEIQLNSDKTETEIKTKASEESIFPLIEVQKREILFKDKNIKNSIFNLSNSMKFINAFNDLVIHNKGDEKKYSDLIENASSENKIPKNNEKIKISLIEFEKEKDTIETKAKSGEDLVKEKEISEEELNGDKSKNIKKDREKGGVLNLAKNFDNFYNGKKFKRDENTDSEANDGFIDSESEEEEEEEEDEERKSEIEEEEDEVFTSEEDLTKKSDDESIKEDDEKKDEEEKDKGEDNEKEKREDKDNSENTKEKKSSTENKNNAFMIVMLVAFIFLAVLGLVAFSLIVVRKKKGSLRVL